MRFSFSVPQEFVLKSTVYSHGWYQLHPFFPVPENNALGRVFELTSGKLVFATISAKPQGGKHALRIETSAQLVLHERKELIAQARTCLRLDEDYSEFYSAVQKRPTFYWAYGIGAGRLLRSPTVWEDVVKMIFTTNCSWALTEIMTENLCKKLGKKVTVKQAGKTVYSFPSAEAIADVTEAYLRKEIRVGYRAPYILELSKKVVGKQIDLESWRKADIPTDELFNMVRSVKGVGPYAAGNLLKLLGHYDYLAIDSWCRKKYFEKHRNGRTVSDAVIEKAYKQFGTWRGLFFWLDLTQYWYEKEVSF